MAIKKYSKKKHGNKKLSEHFKVKEFGCPGTDVIYIDDRLPKYLEKLRKHFEKQAKKSISITITSGYRSVAYNRSVGGSSNSRHIEGRAVDVNVWVDGKRIASKYIMCAAQDLGFIGIGYISPTAAHLDFKKGAKYRYDETKYRNGYFLSFADCYTYFGVKRPAKKPKGKTRYVNTSKGLNVRNKASLTGKIVGALKDNTKVTVVETNGSWSRIGTGKWVASKYLSKTK